MINQKIHFNEMKWQVEISVNKREGMPSEKIDSPLDETRNMKTKRESMYVCVVIVPLSLPSLVVLTYSSPFIDDVTSIYTV